MINGEFVSSGQVEMHSPLKWLTTTRDSQMPTKTLPPIHPGEILSREFLEPLGVSQYRLAKDIGVPPRRINEIVNGTRAITPNTALRLARYFSTSDQFWLNLQTHYALEIERDRLGPTLNKEVRSLAESP